MRKTSRERRADHSTAAWTVSLAVHLLGGWVLANSFESRESRYRLGDRPPSPIELTVGVDDEVSPEAARMEQASPLFVSPAEARMADRTLTDHPSSDVAIDQLLTSETLMRIERFESLSEQVERNVDSPVDPRQRSPRPTEMVRTETVRAERVVENRPAETTAREMPRAESEARPATSGRRISAAGASSAASIVAPDFSGNAPPSYPRQVVGRGWRGEVLLELNVDAEGRVTKVEVVRSSGHAILDAAAVSAVRNWRGKPALRDGTPVESVWKLPIRFSPERR